MTGDTKDKRDLTAGVPLAELEATPLIAGTVGEDAVLLVKAASGLYAIGATCTHSGAPLAEGLLVGDTLRCPWHHACFHVPSGAAVAAPALKAAKRWAVELRDGRAVVSAAQPPLQPRPRKTEERIVIVGAGAAGVAAASALADLGAAAAVTLVGHETETAYDRTALSKHFLAGTLGEDKLTLDMDSLTSRGVTVRLGVTATAIDRAAHLLHLGDDTTLPYTKLILATGGEPKPLTVPGAELPHVHLLRSAADARAVLADAAMARRAVVIGGSFIGFEGAAALRDQGLEVTVVAPEAHPFRTTLGPQLAEAILAKHRDRGTRLALRAAVRRIEPDAVILADGRSLPAEIVLVGIGIGPRTALAERAGLAVEDGVVVDDHLRTDDPAIFAVGDIARWPDPHSGRRIRVEHWAVAQRQGQVAAMNALGLHRRYDVVPFFWTLHFDLSVRYVGHAGKDARTLVDGDLSQRDASLRFIEEGREMAVATVERDRACLDAELAMERRLGGPATTLPAPG